MPALSHDQIDVRSADVRAGLMLGVSTKGERMSKAIVCCARRHAAPTGVLLLILLLAAGGAGQESGTPATPALATPVAPAGSVSAKPSIDDFIQIGSAGDPRISDDGTAVFFASPMAGVNEVYELLRSGWPYQLTVFPDGIDFYEISYTGRRIAVGASSGGSEQSSLYVIDTDTDIITPVKLAEGVQHGSPVWGPDERHLYFRSNEETSRDFYIYGIDVTTGQVEKIWEREGWNEPVAVSGDGALLLASRSTSNTNNDLYMVDLKVGGAVLLTPHEGDCTFEDAHLTPDMEYVYFVTNQTDDGIGRVARKRVPDGAVEFINPDSPWETEEMELSQDGHLLAWIENAEGYSQLRIRSLADSTAVEFGDMRGVITGIDASNAETVVFAFENGTTPRDVWKYDVAEDDLSRLTRSTLAGIDPSLFVEPELIHYRSFDGLGIPAFLYLPRDWNGKPIPFVMEIHGGPESQFRPGFIRNFQYLVSDGYGVLAPNVRGSSGYGREYMQLDDYRKREDAIRDIQEGAKWLVDGGYATYGKIGIKGGSYGGYATLAALVAYPNVFGAGIDDVGIANFVTFLTNTAPYRRALREAEYGPLSDKQFLEEISPLTHAERITTPLLIVHGMNDPRVPVSEARQIAAAVRARGGEVDTLIFADEGHGAAKLSNRLIFYRTMVGFLDKHLKQ